MNKKGIRLTFFFFAYAQNLWPTWSQESIQMRAAFYSAHGKTVCDNIPLPAFVFLFSFDSRPYAVVQCITVLFNLYIRKTHFRVAQYLPTRDCLKADLARDPDFDFSFLRGAYVQPALKAERRLEPEVQPLRKTDSTRTLSSRRLVSLREESIEDV